MKIGIDAKWYFNGPPSGHVVVKNIVDNILRLQDIQQHDIYLFVTSSKEKAIYAFPKYVKIINVLPIPNLLLNLFVLPYYSLKYKLDVLLVQNFTSFFRATKQITYIHDLLFMDFPRYYSIKEIIYFRLIPILARFSSLIITISGQEKIRLSRYIKNKNIQVVYHGINKIYQEKKYFDKTQTSSFFKKYKLNQGYLLYLGRINKRKNIESLIKAIALLKNKSIILVVAGKLDHKIVNVTKIIENLKLNDRVKYIGFVNQEELPFLYANAKIFCFPSYAEGFGLPPLESMKSGVPAIVSNTTSLPEICSSAGVYVDPNKPLDIAKKIEKLLSDDRYYKKKRTESIKRAKYFTWEKSAKNILRIIEKVGH